MDLLAVSYAEIAEPMHYTPSIMDCLYFFIVFVAFILLYTNVVLLIAWGLSNWISKLFNLIKRRNTLKDFLRMSIFPWVMSTIVVLIILILSREANETFFYTKWNIGVEVWSLFLFIILFIASAISTDLKKYSTEVKFIKLLLSWIIFLIMLSLALPSVLDILKEFT